MGHPGLTFEIWLPFGSLRLQNALLHTETVVSRNAQYKAVYEKYGISATDSHLNGELIFKGPN